MKVAIAYSLFGVTYFLMITLIYKKSGIKKEGLKYQFLLFSIYFIAAFLRSYKLNISLPGIDFDEAMGAINSWSIGEWGIDYFNLVSHPVYLYAWGSGMNILYPTIAIPFIKTLGLNMVAYRTPLIMLNIIAIGTVIFALVKLGWPSKKVLLFTIIVFLTPATIVNCRWAVESNLFPTIFYFIFAFFVLYSISEGKARKIYYVMLNLLIAISAYAYSNYWLFLVFFVITFIIWQLKEKNISLKIAIITAIVYCVIELPLILFVYANYIIKKNINFLGLTITKLDATRSVFVEPNIKSILDNLGKTINIYWTGFDGTPKMGLDGLGALLPFMSTFALIGLILWLEYRDKIDQFMIIMLVSLLPNIFLVRATWIHLNATILPLLYLEFKAINIIFKSKKTTITFLMIFGFSLTAYVKQYSRDDYQYFNNCLNSTSVELGQMISYANNSNKDIYLLASTQKNWTNVGAMYVLPIYYTKIPPKQFKKETTNVKPGGMRIIRSFGKWHIIDSSNIKKAELKKNVIYIIQNDTVPSKYLEHHSKIKVGDYYTIYN